MLPFCHLGEPSWLLQLVVNSLRATTRSTHTIHTAPYPAPSPSWARCGLVRLLDWFFTMLVLGIAKAKTTVSLFLPPDPWVLSYSTATPCSPL